MDVSRRCNQCGIRLSEPIPRICPSCSSDMSAVGTWSELDDWIKTQRMGRARYVLVRGVLCWGGLMALGLSIGAYLRGADAIVFVFIVIACVIGGVFVGRSNWNAGEKELVTRRPRYQANGDGKRD